MRLAIRRRPLPALGGWVQQAGERVVVFIDSEASGVEQLATLANEAAHSLRDHVGQLDAGWDRAGMEAAAGTGAALLVEWAEESLHESLPREQSLSRRPLGGGP